MRTRAEKIKCTLCNKYKSYFDEKWMVQPLKIMPQEYPKNREVEP